MNLSLQRRLLALESIRGRTCAADTPQARAVSAAFQQLLAAHDVDGEFARRIAAAESIEARAVALVDLLEVAGRAELRHVLNLIAVARGRQPCPLNT